MFRPPQILSIQDVVRHNLCISCGACAAAVPQGMIVMRYSESHARPMPVILRPELVNGKGLELDVCPGKGLDIVRLGQSISAGVGDHDLYLGVVHKTWAAHSNSREVLEDASSGGIMTEIAAFLLASKRISGIVATRMIYGDSGPLAQTIIARSVQELLGCQGSKYLPVQAAEILGLLDCEEGPVAFIGTPCQIAGLRLLQESVPAIRTKVAYAIGNFCGGTRDYREMHRLIKRQGMTPANIVRFRYRGGAQPGSLLVQDKTGRTIQRPYPDYVGDTGYNKLERCRLCVDGTAELADFACGDAWLDRFLSTGQPWSILITRNAAASTIIEEMVDKQLISVSIIGLEEIKQSQRTNLYSKKTRQAARRQLYRLLQRPVPQYDGGFPPQMTSVMLEIKVQISHALKESLEKVRLYGFTRKTLSAIRGAIGRK